MTDTIEAPGITREPIPAHELNPDEMHQALKWLLKAAKQLVGHVERNSSEVHKALPSVKEAVHSVEDLLYPPPPPEAPEGVVSLFAHAVREGDLVWIPPSVPGPGVHSAASGWVQVRSVKWDSQWIRWVTNAPGDNYDPCAYAFKMNDLFSVKRAERVGEDE